MQELICCGPLRLSKLTPDTILIYRLDTQTEHTLDSVAARIVETVWQRPRTMAYCVNELRHPLSAVSRWDSHQAATVLNELLSSGVLVRVADMLRSLSLKSRDSEAEPISWLAIPTRDRPQSLLRTLRSFSSNMQQYDVRAKILISIDSQSTDGESAIRATIAEWAKASTTTIVLAGADLKAAYARRLAARTGVPLDVIQFALWGRGHRGPAIGANRNAISLFTAGCRVLSADDDTLCEAARIASATSSSALRFMAHGDPADLWFFDDRLGALESTEPVDVNVLGAHAEVLGTKLGSMIRTHFNSQVDISDACQHLIQSAWLGDGRVCLTHNGIVGDSGMYSGRPLLLHRSPATRKRLSESPRMLATGLGSREVVRQTEALTVCHSAPVMTTFIGYDNREILPPFFPLYCNEDGLFGFCVVLCIPGAYTAHLPFVLPHCPNSARNYASNRWKAIRMTDLIAACASKLAPDDESLSASQRMIALGRQLSELGSTGFSEFSSYVRVAVVELLQQTLNAQMTGLQESNELPSFYRAELEKDSHELSQTIDRADCWMPVDVQERYTPGEVPRAVRHLIFDFGRLLSYWPEIVAGAQQLANER